MLHYCACAYAACGVVWGVPLTHYHTQRAALAALFHHYFEIVTSSIPFLHSTLLAHLFFTFHYILASLSLLLWVLLLG